MGRKPLILIIDDDVIVRKILAAILKTAGYNIEEAQGGESGLIFARERMPDLILLDIQMPEMDGYQVINNLKSLHKTAEIPVIFLSATSEAADKVRGLELGAADFVNKPFDRAELLARIKTHLKLRHQEMALKEYSQNLEQMVAERTQQLIHADRLASLGTLSAGVAHEINNPTTFIMGNVQTLEQFWKIMTANLADWPRAAGEAKIQYILKEFPAIIKSIRSGAERITNIVAGLKAFARKDASQKKQVDLYKCLNDALQLTHSRLKYHVQIVKNLASDLPPVWADAPQLVQVFVNLLLNAADALGDRDGIVTISASSEPEGLVQVNITDTGPGMSAAVKDKIFNPFFTTKPIGQGTGLGLSIVHGIIEDHRGTIKVNSEIGKGTTFTITLPTEQAG